MKIQHIIPIITEGLSEEYLWTDLGKMCSYFGASNQRHSNLTTNALMRRYPQLIYRGNMYRVLFFTGKDFIKYESPQELMNSIKQHQYDFNGKNVYSFCKTTAGMVAFMQYIMDDDYFNIKSVNDIQVMVFLQQNGFGLDIRKAYEYRSGRNENVDGLHKAASVEEIVAEPNKSIKIIGYQINGIEDIYDFEHAEGDSEEVVYNPIDERYGPNDFYHLLYSLHQQLQGVPLSKRKNARPNVTPPDKPKSSAFDEIMQGVDDVMC